MYPYVVVRYMATVYGRFAVKFVEREERNLKAERVDDTFVVVCQQPYAVAETLTPEAKAALLDGVQAASRQSRHRMCVVFGDNECVFVESEGTAKLSAELPSGGIQCLRFPIRLRET